MTTIALRPDLEQQLKPEAERRQTSVENLANDWLENQLWQEWHRVIEEESSRFQEKHAELLTQYAGEYVAMRSGSVIDHDVDLPTLHQRIRAEYGDEPILMAPVSALPIQKFKVRSPRRQMA
jgi:hypothetical protein